MPSIGGSTDWKVLDLITEQSGCGLRFSTDIEIQGQSAMNKIYSKVWNKELGQLVVASELKTARIARRSLPACNPTAAWKSR